MLFFLSVALKVQRLGTKKQTKKQLCMYIFISKFPHTFCRGRVKTAIPVPSFSWPCLCKMCRVWFCIVLQKNYYVWYTHMQPYIVCNTDSFREGHIASGQVYNMAFSFAEWVTYITCVLLSTWLSKLLMNDDPWSTSVRQIADHGSWASACPFRHWNFSNVHESWSCMETLSSLFFEAA